MTKEKTSLRIQLDVNDQKEKVAKTQSVIKQCLRKVELDRHQKQVNSLVKQIEDLKEEIKRSTKRQSLLHAQKCAYQIENETLKQKVTVISKQKNKLDRKVKFLTKKMDNAGIPLEEIVMPDSTDSESEDICVGK